MIVLDTNIVSYYFKRHTLWHSYFPITLGKDMAVSFQSIAELEEGTIVAEWSEARKEKLVRFLDRFVVIQSTPKMCLWWGWIRAIRKAQPISATDAWIAATALSYDLDLVTHNPKDFRGIPGLRVLSAAEG